MNREAILAVADSIERGEPGLIFNMRFWNDRIDDCGTACCIGGWTEQLFPEEAASDSLGLSQEQIGDLFMMLNTEHPFRAVTPAIAVRCLRNFAKTGEVDWDRAFEEAA